MQTQFVGSGEAFDALTQLVARYRSEHHANPIGLELEARLGRMSDGERVTTGVSEEEIDRIEELVDALLGGHYEHAKAGGIEEGTLTASNILVTAPYNVQVNRLQQRLNGRARVGTVDKFQGQESPVAIHSLTASSGDNAPRGLSFLLEPNRLNVAISRAQCLSIVVGSPSLASGIANTVAEAEQINRFCRMTCLGGEEL